LQKLSGGKEFLKLTDQARTESQYYIPYRWKSDCQYIDADGPFSSISAKIVYEIMARNTDWEVHPPKLAISREEAIQWATSIGFLGNVVADEHK
jgi:hypothetical protein